MVDNVRFPGSKRLSFVLTPAGRSSAQCLLVHNTEETVCLQKESLAFNFTLELLIIIIISTAQRCSSCTYGL